MTDFGSLNHIVTSRNHDVLIDIMQESSNLRTANCMGSLTDCSITRNLTREHNYFSENFKQNVVFPNDFMEQNARSSSSESFISDISLIQDPISEDRGIESLLATSTDSKVTLTDPCYQVTDESSLTGSLDISKMSSSFEKNHFEVSSPDSAFSEGSLNDFESDDNTRIETLINQLMSNSEDLQSDISNYLQSDIPSSEEIASFDIDTFFSSDFMNGDLFSGNPNASICTSSYRETPNLFDNKLKPLFDDFVSSSKDIAESNDIPEATSSTGTFDHGFKSSTEQSLFGSSSADMFESTSYFDDMDYLIPMVNENSKSSESTSSSSSSSTFSAASQTVASSTSSSNSTPSSSSSSSSSTYSRNILLTCRKQINCFREPERRLSNEHSYNAPKLFVKPGSKIGSLSKKLQTYSHDKDKDKESRTNSRLRLQSHSDPSVVIQRHSDYNQIKTSRSAKKKDMFAAPEVISKGNCLRKVLTGHLSHPLSSTSSNPVSNQRQPTFVQSASLHRKTDSRYFGNVNSMKETAVASQSSTADPKKHIFKTPLPSQAFRSERGDVSELEKYLRGMIPINGDNAGQSSPAGSNIGSSSCNSKNWNGVQKTNTSFLYKLLTGEISQELYREIDRKLRETETASIIS